MGEGGGEAYTEAPRTHRVADEDGLQEDGVGEGKVERVLLGTSLQCSQHHSLITDTTLDPLLQPGSAGAAYSGHGPQHHAALTG